MGFGNIFRRKALSRAGTGAQLARHLTTLQLIPVGVGSTIGAGVYVLVGTVAREKVGPALPWSFLIAGIAAALSALCYAELASRCPSAGSAYHYAYICVGEGIAWIIGWALILEYTVGGSTVARGISPNLGLFVGGAENLPAFIIRKHIPALDVTLDPCAAMLCIIVTILLCSGIKESAMVQSVMTMLNVLVLLFVIVAGTYAGCVTGWKGYEKSQSYTPYGINGILGGAATLFFAYIGFDTVASTAEEVQNPQRDLPRGIAFSLMICSFLYMLVSSVIVGIVPYNEMDPDTPMSTAFAANQMPWAMYIVTAGAVAALSTTLMGSLLPQPRILMAMGRDGLLPPFFAEIHKTTLVPVNSTVLSGLGACLMAFVMDVDELAGMVSVGTLLAFTIVGVCILILRYLPPSELPIPVHNVSDLPTSPTNRHSSQLGTIPALSSYFTKRDYFSPVLSLLSEASLKTLPGFLRDDDDDDASSEASSSDSLTQDLLTPEEEAEPCTPSKRKASVESSLLQNEHPTSDLETVSSTQITKDEARRWAAALAIGSVCIGSIFTSVSASISLPNWLVWSMVVLGLPLLVAGTMVLFLIEQDEERHNFGQVGGEHDVFGLFIHAAFYCPGVPLLPVCSIQINMYLLVNLGSSTWMKVGVWLLLGVFIYAGYGINHSKICKEVERESSQKNQSLPYSSVV